MLAKKNLKKGLVILLALLSVFTVAFSMSGCSVDKGTYVNHAENAYIIVNDDDVELYNICVDKYSTVKQQDVKICLMKRVKYTYSTSYNNEKQGYPIYVTVGTVDYIAYYDNKHGDTHIKFERQAFTQSGNVEFIKFYKGTPNVQYNPLYL